MDPRRAGRTKLACSGDEKCDIIRDGRSGREIRGRLIDWATLCSIPGGGDVSNGQ